MVEEKNPSRQVKRAQHPRSVEGPRQQGGVRLGEFLSPPQQTHGDKETSVGKKGTSEFRHRDRMRRGGDDCRGKDADRDRGGPRYPAFSANVKT
jgi:hypothetical protein